MDDSLGPCGIVQHEVLNSHFNFHFNFHFNSNKNTLLMINYSIAILSCKPGTKKTKPQAQAELNKFSPLLFGM